MISLIISLDVNGFLELNITLMVLLTCLKLV